MHALQGNRTEPAAERAIDGLIARLAAFLGPGELLVGDAVAQRSAGFIRPQENLRAAALVRPRSTASVSRVMAACNEFAVPVVPISGLTGMADGALTSPGEIALSLEFMNRIEALDAEAGTLTLEAGVTLQQAQEHAARHGLLLAVDIGARGSALIGGVISTNAGGLKVIRYGPARDQVLGLEAVLADGRVVDCMTGIVKNNTGIDLKHVFIGSEGILGVVTRAVLRLRPLMTHARTAMVGFEDFGQAARMLAFARANLDASLSSFELMWDDFIRFVTRPGLARAPFDRVYPLTALIETEYAGEEQSLRFDAVMADAVEAGLLQDAVVAQSEAQRRAIWSVREGNEHLELMQPQFRYDVSVPVGHMERYVAQVWERLDADNPGGHRFTFGHAGDNNIHFVIVPGAGGFDHAAADRIVYEPLRAFRGVVSAEHGIGLAKKGALGYSRSDIEIGLMRDIKRTLDPKGILNPGKVFDLNRDTNT